MIASITALGRIGEADDVGKAIGAILVKDLTGSQVRE